MELNGRRNVGLVSTEPNPGAPPEALHEEYELSVKDFLGVLHRRWLAIVLVMALFAGAVVVFDFLQTPTYQASIKMLVGQEQKSNASSNLGSDVQGLQQITQTVAEVVHTRTVAEAVIERLDLQTTPEEFLKNMNVRQTSRTQVIEISYRDPNPYKAQQIANTIGEVFSDQVTEVSANANAITATVWEAAAVPDSPVSPKPLRDELVALVLGGMLGMGVAFLLERLDDRWRSPEEVEQIAGVPTFGVIREFEGFSKSKGAETKEGRIEEQAKGDEKGDDLAERLASVVGSSAEAASEDYNSLLTNLLGASANGAAKIVVITSPEQVRGVLEGQEKQGRGD